MVIIHGQLASDLFQLLYSQDVAHSRIREFSMDSRLNVVPGRLTATQISCTIPSHICRFGSHATGVSTFCLHNYWL